MVKSPVVYNSYGGCWFDWRQRRMRWVEGFRAVGYREDVTHL